MDSNSPTIRPDSTILRIPKAIDDQACAQLVSLANHHHDRAPRKLGEDRLFDRRVLHLEQILQLDPSLGAIMIAIGVALTRAVTLNFRSADLAPDDIQIVRWDEGHSMDVHADCEQPEGGPNTTPWRSVAAIGFLNADFVGGELVFPTQGVVVKPEAGDVVIFPGTWEFAHGVTRVISGRRFTCATWFTADRARHHAIMAQALFGQRPRTE